MNTPVKSAERVLDMLDAHVDRVGATLVVVTHDHDVSQRFDRTIDVSVLAGERPPQDRGQARDV